MEIRSFESEVIENALAILDTDPHNSSVSNVAGFKSKTFVFENGLNQEASCQVQGASESTFAKPVNIGSAVAVATVANGFVTKSDIFPYMRVVTTCAVAPASGSITIRVEKLGV